MILKHKTFFPRMVCSPKIRVSNEMRRTIGSSNISQIDGFMGGGQSTTVEKRNLMKDQFDCYAKNQLIVQRRQKQKKKRKTMAMSQLDQLVL